MFDYKMSLVDALYFPGGGDIKTGLYMQDTTYLMNKVVEINQNGGYMPLWGTCLGFEAILMVAARDTSIIDPRPSIHKSINLIFAGMPNES